MVLSISRILHAGYLFEYGDSRIAFDPIFESVFSRNCHAYPAVEFDRERIRKLELDAVFISHHHDDHCSLESLDLLDRRTPIYLYCPEGEMFELIRSLGFTSVRALEVDSRVEAGAFEIVPRLALDPDVDTIFHVKAGGLNVLNVVDAWIDPRAMERLEREAPWDLVLWPFQTMREIAVLSPSRAEKAARSVPPEWLEQLKALRPRFVVPSSCQFIHESWSWYNRAMFPISYRRFASEVSAVLPETRVVRMEPSASVVLERGDLRPAPPLEWVRSLGGGEVEYELAENARPPSTAEIARHFPALSTAKTEDVLSYCRIKMPERYRELGPSSEEYFARARRWRLTLYDHEGVATHLHFRLRGDEMTLIDEDDGLLAWTTEVPIARLHGALAHGESLTSMYVRVNDQAFAPEIEREVASADVVEDPLIRSLFSGVFGAYQKAQLARLRGRR